MKKHLYIIGGTMGSGKTALCRVLKKKLNNSVFLDGDWCWDMEPFQVTEETKAMVMENIAFLLNNFLKCSAFEHIIFCWVLHEQEILDNLLSRIHGENVCVHTYSLMINQETLQKRLERDIRLGLRTEDILERSIPRIPLYERLNTKTIQVSGKTPEEAAQSIREDFEYEERKEIEGTAGEKKVEEKKTEEKKMIEENKIEEALPENVLKELEAYRKMHQAVKKEYASIVNQMEKQKEAGRTKSATYRQLMGRKLTYSTMLDLYKLYDLED